MFAERARTACAHSDRASAGCGKLGPLAACSLSWRLAAGCLQPGGASRQRRATLLRKRGGRQAWALAAQAASGEPGVRKRGVRQAWALGCFAALAASWLLAAWAAKPPSGEPPWLLAALAVSWGAQAPFGLKLRVSWTTIIYVENLQNQPFQIFINSFINLNTSCIEAFLKNNYLTKAYKNYIFILKFNKLKLFLLRDRAVW